MIVDLLNSLALQLYDITDESTNMKELIDSINEQWNAICAHSVNKQRQLEEAMQVIRNFHV